MESFSFIEIISDVGVVVGIIVGVLGIYAQLKNKKRQTWEKKLRPQLGSIPGTEITESDVKHSLKHYQQNRYTLLSSEQDSEPDSKPDVLDHLIKTIEGKNPPPFVLITAESGMGKTALLYALHQRYEYKGGEVGRKSRKYFVRYFPVRDFSVETLQKVKHVLQDPDAVSFPAKKHFLLLLDALDEDLGKSHRIHERVEELMDIASKEAAVLVLTSRIQLFQSEQETQLPKQFNRGARPSTDWHRIHLQPFSKAQISEYIYHAIPSSQHIRDQANQIINSMGELATRPLLLSHLPQLMELESRYGSTHGKNTEVNPQKNPESKSSDDKISKPEFLHLSADLYEYLLLAWLRQEAVILKKANKLTVPLKEFMDRSFRFSLILARKMWADGQKKDLTAREIEELAEEHQVLELLESLKESGRKRQLKTRSLLIQTNTSWTFAHQSFWEFLFAKNLWEDKTVLIPDPNDPFLHKEWQQTSFPPTSIEQSKLPLGVLSFLNEMAWREYFMLPARKGAEGENPGLNPLHPNRGATSLPYSNTFPSQLPRLYWKKGGNNEPEPDWDKLLDNVLSWQSEEQIDQIDHAYEALPDMGLRVLLLRTLKNAQMLKGHQFAWHSLQMLIKSLDSDAFQAEKRTVYGAIAQHMAANKQSTIPAIEAAQQAAKALDLPISSEEEKGFADQLASIAPLLIYPSTDSGRQQIRFLHPTFQKWALFTHYYQANDERARDSSVFWEPYWKGVETDVLLTDLQSGYTGHTDRGWAISQTDLVPWEERTILDIHVPRLVKDRAGLLFEMGNAWEELGFKVQGIRHLKGIEGLSDSLKQLYLDHNPLAELSPLPSLDKLETLSLIGCELDHFLSRDAFPRLRQLYLGQNPRLNAAPDWLQLTALRELDLSGTALTNLQHLPSGLHILRLSDCPHLRSLDGIERLTGLQQLELDTSPETDLQISDWTPLLACTQLHTLVLGKGARPRNEQFAQMKALRHLFLPRTASVLETLRPQLAGLGIAHQYEVPQAKGTPVADLPEGFVRVPGGVFVQGSEDCLNQDGAYTSESPSHQVAVAPFALAETPVSRGEFQTFMQQTAYRSTAEQHLSSNPGIKQAYRDPNLGSQKEEVMRSWKKDALGLRWQDDGDHPVLYVSWYDACAYANWCSEQEGLPPCYSFGQLEVQINVHSFDQIEGVLAFTDTGGYRLPTEVEWEYAAGWAEGGARHRFAGTSEEAELPSFAHFGSSTGTAPLRPRDRTPNPLGLYDLNGNVYEWCQAAFGRYAPFLQIDHAGKGFWQSEEEQAEGVKWLRPLKGPWWGSGNKMLFRVADRNHGYPLNHSYLVGFRLARTLPS